MSAFLCSARHIGTVAAYAFTVRVLPTMAAARKFASELNACNNAALAARYGDKPQKLTGRDAAICVAMTELSEKNPQQAAAYVHELCRCLAYQCSEGDVDKMPVFRDLGNLQKLCEELRGNTRDNATWSI